MDNQTTADINKLPPEEARNSAASSDKKVLQPMIVLLAVLIGVTALQTLQLNSLAKAIKNGVVATQGANQSAGSFLNTLKSQVGGCGG